MGRTALVGHSGFVGGALKRVRAFDALFNSTNIEQIVGESFELVVCAGAPATMWAANSDPAGDAGNLARLVAALKGARIETLVLISTVAVFDDIGAGYTESRARFESAKAYGRNRRELEIQLSMAAQRVITLRLPALFGVGLKKNFIFDLLNPEPSFVRPEKYEAVAAALTAGERAALHAAYVFDEGLKMWRLLREQIRGTEVGRDLLAGLMRVGFLAKTFTHSESRYQFYNIERLSGDIDACIVDGIEVLNICAEPLSAREVHRALLGSDFMNEGPARISEDVRSEHAARFGAAYPYLFDRDQTLFELRSYFEIERAA